MCETARSIVFSLELRKTTLRNVGDVALYMCRMACLQPATESIVRLMRSSRAGVRTYCVSEREPKNIADRLTDLYPDIVWYFLIFDEASNEVKVSVASSGVCDFDFLDTRLDQLAEEGSLLFDGHWICQRLVSVAQVSREPQRGFGECF